MVKKHIKKIKKKINLNKMSDLFGGESEFTKEKVIEGMIIRPAIFMIAFLSFLVSVFLLFLPNYKWAGSFIVFSFVFNMYSIYQSFCDEESIFKSLNLTFKIILFVAELIFFNWLAIKTGLFLFLI